MESPVVVDGIALNVDASIGIAVLEDDSEDLDDLLQHADAALARARSQRSRVEVYSRQYDSFDPARLLLLGAGALWRWSATSSSCTTNRKIDLHSGRVTGVEALLRWRHPERGLLAPLSFIPLVEQTALDRTGHAARARARAGADGALARARPRAEHVGQPLCAQPARARAAATHRGAPAPPPDRARAPHRRGHRERRDGRSRPRRRGAARAAATAESACRSTTSAPATPRSPISRACPQTRSRSTNPSSPSICEDERAEAIVRSTIDLARHLDLHVVAEGIETAGGVRPPRRAGLRHRAGLLHLASAHCRRPHAPGWAPTAAR